MFVIAISIFFLYILTQSTYKTHKKMISFFIFFLQKIFLIEFKWSSKIKKKIKN